MFPAVYFDNIHYLWLLAAVPFYLLFSLRAFLQDRSWRHSFSGEKTGVLPHLTTTLLICLTIAAVAGSVSRPRVQYEKTYFNRGGIDLVIGLDVSKSMLAEDTLFPEGGKQMFHILNRLNRGRYFVLNMTSKLHGERIGVYVFAKAGVEIVPFTNDYGFCHYIVRHVNAGDITAPGSDLDEAIKTGLSMLSSASEKGARAMVLISDGEDISQDKSHIYESARLAAEKRVRIYTVGVGTGKTALIPLRHEDSEHISSYLLGDDGTFLKTRLEQEALIKIAGITGGRYFRVNERDAPQQLMAAVLEHARRSEGTSRIEPAWLDLSPFCSAAALFLIILEILARRFFLVSTDTHRKI